MNRNDYPLMPGDEHLRPYLPPYKGKIDTSDPNYMELDERRERLRKEALDAVEKARSVLKEDESDYTDVDCLDQISQFIANAPEGTAFYFTNISFSGLDYSSTEDVTMVGNNRIWPSPDENEPPQQEA